MANLQKRGPPFLLCFFVYQPAPDIGESSAGQRPTYGGFVKWGNPETGEILKIPVVKRNWLIPIAVIGFNVYENTGHAIIYQFSIWKWNVRCH